MRVERQFQPLGFPDFQRVEMRDLASRVDSRVGPSGAGHSRLLADRGESGLQGILNSAPVRLRLPAQETAAVVRQF
jgi:hypothetical protein